MKGRNIFVSGDWGIGPGLSIGQMLIGNNDNQPVMELEYVDGGKVVSDSGVTINTINVGGDPGPIILGHSGGAINIGTILHYAEETAVPHAVELKGIGPAWIGSVGLMSGTADYLVSFGVNAGYKGIFGLANVGSYNNNYVEIANQPGAPSYVFGTSSGGVDNNAGSTTGNVRTMTDAGTGNG